MCGIAGFLRLDGAPADESRLREMESRLAHRGPDGAGIFRDGPLGFAHRRLSIIDLATGDQPMTRADLDRTVIFNGEIYNYLELRADLLRLGHRFQTASDTEVLLVGHAAWGDELFPRLRGMFALALWDASTRQLTLARDPLGKKPLQLSHLPGKFLAFGSEAKALFALPEVSRAIEPQAIAAYLDWMYVPEQMRLYRDIERLQAGERLTIEPDGRVRRAFYAANSRAEVSASITFDEACARVDALVKEATRIRLRADVPLGVFLSGGIDSTLVALAAAPQVPGKLRTYTVGFRGASDERPYAAEVARAIGAAHTELEVDLDAPAVGLEILRHFDEPFGDSSAVPVLAIARETRKSVKVVLSGDGGDEIFGGYGWYLRHLRAPAGAAAHRGPNLVRRALGAAIGIARDRARRLPAPVSARIAELVRPLRKQLDSAADLELRDPVLRQLYAMKIARAASSAELLAPLLAGAPLQFDALASRVPRGLSPLRSAMRTDRALYLPGDILKKVDICAMRVGLEVRSPLLDDDLIALADALPEGFLVSRVANAVEEAFGKRPLKALVAARMGDKFAWRPKQGFGAPVQEWLADPRFVSIAHEGFLETASPLRPWFTPGALPRIWSEFRAGKRWLAQEVWNLIALDAWARQSRPT